MKTKRMRLLSIFSVAAVLLSGVLGGGVLSAVAGESADASANLIINGDFEGNASYWRNSRMIRDGIGKDGSRGFLLSNAENGARIDCYYNAEIAVQPATTYRVSFDCYGAEGASYRLYGGNLGMGSVRGEAPAGEWNHVEYIFTTPITMKLQKTWDFSLVNDSDGIGGTAVIDNVRLCLYTTGVEAESVALSRDGLVLEPGRTEELHLLPTPDNGDINCARWASSDEDVVTAEYGLITAVGKGKATVTATLPNGRTATGEVIVGGAPAQIKNSTFENTAVPVWKATGNAVIEDGAGSNSSRAGAVRGNGTLSQSITGLKPNTVYRVYLRCRSTGGDGRVRVTGGETNWLDAVIGGKAAFTGTVLEFCTPPIGESPAADLVLSAASGAGGTVYFDHVFVVQKSSEIDLAVRDVVWNGAGDQVATGTGLTFTVTVENRGTEAVTADEPFKIDIMIDRERVERLIYTKALPGGEADTVTGTVTWPAVAGTHTLWANVNAELDILEKDSGNNLRQVSLYVADTPLEVPAVARRAGFDKLVFNDEFDSMATVDTAATGGGGYKWYVTRPYGAKTLAKGDYTVENGVLTVCNEIPTYNYGLGSADAKTQNGFFFNRGYLEYRVRIPRPRRNEDGEKGIPAVWALSKNKLYNQTDKDGHLAWVEMDFLEYVGNGIHTTVYHEQKTDSGQLVSHCRNTDYTEYGLGDEEWHIMSFLWEYNRVTEFIDGKQVQVLNYRADGYDIGHVECLVGTLENGVFTGLNTQPISLILGGSRDNPMEIDWVRVWQGDTVYGDANGDGAVDAKDAVRLCKYLASYEYETKTASVDVDNGADANGDGTVDSKDVVRLRKYLAAYDFETGTSTVKLGPIDN